MIKFKTCPMCGSRRVQQVCEDVPFNIAGRRIVVPLVTFARCDACNEQFFDHEANQKIDAVIFPPHPRSSKRKTTRSSKATPVAARAS